MNREVLSKIGFWLLLGNFFSAVGFAQVSQGPVAQLDSAKETLNLAPFAEVWQDPSGQMAFEDVEEIAAKGEFQTLTGSSFSKGFSRDATWFRFTLKNTSLFAKVWYLDVGNPSLDLVILYKTDAFGTYQAIVTGDRQPMRSRPVGSRTFHFPIKMPPNGLKTFFLKVQTEGSLNVPLTVRSEEAYTTYKTRDIFLLSLYFGFVLALFLYNAFLAVPLRHMGYPCYVVYIGTHFLAQLSFTGAAMWVLWPNSPDWANIAIPFFVTLTTFCGMQFTFKFLEIDEHLPRPHFWISRLNPILLAMGIVLSLFAPYRVAAVCVLSYTLVWCITAISLGFASFFKKKRQAVFYLLGWTFYIAGVLINTFRVLGLDVPLELGTYGMLLGSLIELTVLSLGLADRINVIGREKAQVVNRLADKNRVLQYENSERQKAENALIRSQETLERKVLERTKDLGSANQSLRQEVQKHQQTEEKLKLAHQRAEEESMAKSRFLANMSHEIRTPLNAIVGLSELLLEDSKKAIHGEKRHNYLENIHRSGYHLSQVINHILDLSKIEAGKVDLSLEPVRLPAIVRDIFEVCYQQAQGKGVKLSYSMEEQLPEWIKTDHTALRRILLNLVSNAVKFTPAGRKVDFEINTDEDALVFRIIDEGIGIPKARQKAIFNAFEQADNTTTRQFGGTGLGLAISQKLAEILGGHISLESEEGTGSTFTVSLPYRECESPQVMPQNSHDPETHFDPSSLVLVAEDNQTNLFVLRALMGRVGLSIHHAENGKKAVTMAKALKPDIILMDMHMPVMDGLEATQLLRSQPETAGVPIVAITADAFKEKRLHALAHGFSDYIVKPIHLPMLVAVLKKYLKPIAPKEADLQRGLVEP